MFEVPPSTQGAMAAESGLAEQQYSLRWNDFHSAILSSFRHLRDEEDFVDVTLACDGRSFHAHKVVLSACSPYFRRLLKANPCQHPIVILRDIQNKDMESLLRFMYNGEVHIGHEQLADFLKAAQMLQVRGLADVPTPGVPIGKNLEQKVSPSSTSWSDSQTNNESACKERRSRRGDHNNASQTPPPPPKRARSSDLYNEQLKTRTEHLLGNAGSPDRIGNNGHNSFKESLLSQALESVQNTNHLSADGDDSSSDAALSDNECDIPRSTIAKTEPMEYGGDDSNIHATNGGIMDSGRTPNFHGSLLSFPGMLAGPSGIPDNFGVPRRSLDMLRVRATDPRPCPKCGKIYRSAHTLRTHLEDKHTVCSGYRCVLCGTVAKSRNSLHSHMSRQHRGISTKDLPVLPMPSKFDPDLASKLLAKAGVKISPAELRARASPTGPRRSDIKLDAKSGQSAQSETSSVYGDNDVDDLSITPSAVTRYQDILSLSPPHINNLANTTITKVPAVRAVTAKTIESMAHGLNAKNDDCNTPALGSVHFFDKYLQMMAENSIMDQHRASVMAKMAHLNTFTTHMDRKPYDAMSPPPHLPQPASLPPTPTLLQQMQRHYVDNGPRLRDIIGDDDQPLDLGKERDTNDRYRLAATLVKLNHEYSDKDREYRSHERADEYEHRRSVDHNERGPSSKDDYSDDETHKDVDSS